jgi:hypothetical protein
VRCSKALDTRVSTTALTSSTRPKIDDHPIPSVRFSLKEYDRLRDEIQWLLKDYRALERYAVLAVGAFWACGWSFIERTRHGLHGYCRSSFRSSVSFEPSASGAIRRLAPVFAENRERIWRAWRRLGELFAQERLDRTERGTLLDCADISDGRYRNLRRRFALVHGMHGVKV